MVMNSRSIKIAGLAILIGISSIIFIAFQNNTDALRRELLLKVVSFAISNGHYHPAEVNDAFSEKAFDLYLERMDFGKRFLLKEDVGRCRNLRKNLMMP